MNWFEAYYHALGENNLHGDAEEEAVTSIGHHDLV
jgi:hypothetical protein